MNAMRESKHDFIVHTKNPYNAEPPLHRLRASMITAVADCYVRSHGNVPELNEQEHRLQVSGHVEMLLSLSTADVRLFTPKSVIAVMQCAGNRRSDMRRVRPV
jgi:sulfite oxidase